MHALAISASVGALSAPLLICLNARASIWPRACIRGTIDIRISIGKILIVVKTVVIVVLVDNYIVAA